MKKSFLRIIFIIQMVLLPLFLGSVFADPPNPPGPGGSPVGPGGGLPVGGAIDDGLSILLALGVAYGVYRFYEIWKRKKSVSNDDTIKI